MILKGRSCDSCIQIAKRWGVQLGATVAFHRGMEQVEAECVAITHIDSRVVLLLDAGDGAPMQVGLEAAILGVAPGLSQDVWGPMEAGA